MRLARKALIFTVSSTISRLTQTLTQNFITSLFMLIKSMSYEIDKQIKNPRVDGSNPPLVRFFQRSKTVSIQNPKAGMKSFC
jgi:hypothetical protein